MTVADTIEQKQLKAQHGWNKQAEDRNYQCGECCEDYFLREQVIPICGGCDDALHHELFAARACIAEMRKVLGGYAYHKALNDYDNMIARIQS
jgi:hypothetical protein